MPYAEREFTCIGCGAQHRRRAPAGSRMRCVPCAVAYSAENARQIAAGEGPLYDRWLWATVQWARARQLAIRTVTGRVAS